ncbi:protein NUCLEAR FUSION DEFECTIVE 4-like isoform X1 [Populus alba x Populus x berolinensis]|nr:protein NUCLEAR FUSION DEFECTIVE 4-like isoform X1 [Populus alba x Populus x berolinensis]
MCPLLSPASPSGKWLGFVTAIWVQAVCGNNYTFSNYSDALKSIMALTQLELNTLSVAKDVGKAFGLLSGIASDRWSTSVILLIGSFEGLIGYGVQWLVVSQRIHPLPYWQMCIFLCLGGNSTTWMNTAVLVTCIRNFPNNRGPVSGILKGYVGLSTAIFTDICTALFNSNPSAFLLILAIVPAIICLAAIPFLRETTSAAGPIEEKEETRFFNIFNAIAIIAAAYLLAFDITGNHGHVVSLVFVAGLLFLLATPLFVPLYSVLLKLKSNWDIEQQIKEPLLAGPEDSPAKPQEPEPATTVSVEVDNAGIKQQPMIGEDHTIIEMIRTYDFWILFLSFLCGVGTGMCVMNNLGQMGLALGYVDVSIFVSLTSIWGFFGRIISGLVSEQLLWKFGTPRPLWNAASQVLMTLGYVIMALTLPGSLYIGSILVGICYGVRLTITVAVASELFGLKYYGVLYNILILNLPLGSFLFSGLLAGYLYDAQAARSPAGGGNTCVGPHCYFLVFLIMALACVIGFGLDVLLAIRTKKVYSKIYTDRKFSPASTVA